MNLECLDVRWCRITIYRVVEIGTRHYRGKESNRSVEKIVTGHFQALHRAMKKNSLSNEAFRYGRSLINWRERALMVWHKVSIYSIKCKEHNITVVRRMLIFLWELIHNIQVLRLRLERASARDNTSNTYTPKLVRMAKNILPFRASSTLKFKYSKTKSSTQLSWVLFKIVPYLYI